MIELTRGNVLTDDADALVREVENRDIQSIAIPPLGSGLGGLQWHRVKEMIATAFADMPDVQVKLYEPANSPDARDMPVGIYQQIKTDGKDQ
ncbi:MAG: hypothetical protein SWH68_06920 [Thermodesulfobacteriota bacterium]|nr:hypothetical protein [Thermodesulfobacteriota bacterium]